MDKTTQQLIIITLGIIGITSLIYNKEQALLIIIGIIGGFLTNKTLTEKQQETLREYHLQQIQDTEEVIEVEQND